MEYRQLGRTGVQVSPLCLGGMLFGGKAPEVEANRIIDVALDSGINCIDTANISVRGRSEEVIGAALKRNGERSQVVLATKVFGRIDDSDPAGFSPRGSLSIHWASVNDYLTTGERRRAAAQSVFGAILRGELQLHIATVLPLERAAQAHSLLESGATTGKLLLQVR